MITQELKELLSREGYFALKEVPNRGIVGLCHFAFTTGLVYGITASVYEGRYCYPRAKDALEAFDTWDGVGDPPGPWVKHKGHIEYRNPNLDEEDID